jgi:hypothetical protein
MVDSLPLNIISDNGIKPEHY